MRPTTIGEFARLCDGSLSGAGPGDRLVGFATDSRDVQPGYLFLAIKGSRVDGHDYVGRAMEAGAVAALVERPVPFPHIRVASLVEALATFAQKRRQTFRGPVVGITGSNGKTTTKEFLSAALEPKGRVLKSPGNKNSEFTSPLVWTDLLPDHQSAVIEMAMRGFGQIRHLAKLHSPSAGIITCIGTAHIEMVGSRQGIARAKGELLLGLPPHAPSALWQEDDFLDDLCKMAPGPVHTFGFSPEADCRIIGYRALDWQRSQVVGTLRGKDWEAVLPVVGRHQALNAAAAVLVADLLGVSAPIAADRLSSATLPPMRMEHRSVRGVTIILDTYNASPDSTIAALAALVEGPCEGRRLAILGEMRELGDFEEWGHRHVGKAAGKLAVDEMLLLGASCVHIYEEVLAAGYPPERVESLPLVDLDRVVAFLGKAKPGDVVLVKGSRALELEHAVEAWSK